MFGLVFLSLLCIKLAEEAETHDNSSYAEPEVPEMRNSTIDQTGQQLGQIARNFEESQEEEESKLLPLKQIKNSLLLIL